MSKWVLFMIGLVVGLLIGSSVAIVSTGFTVVKFIDKVDVDELIFNVDLNETEMVNAMLPYIQEEQG